MIRCNTFARSALFAAIAAIGWLSWALIAGPILGLRDARAVYLVGIAALYVGGLSRQTTHGIAGAVVAGLAACGVAVGAHTTAELAIGLALIVGVARSGFLYRAAPAQAVIREVVLLGGGLLWSRFLTGYSLPSMALAIWGFFLVQSLFFVSADGRGRRGGEPLSDPFEAAYRRALVLLEQAGV